MYHQVIFPRFMLKMAALALALCLLGACGPAPESPSAKSAKLRGLARQDLAWLETRLLPLMEEESPKKLDFENTLKKYFRTRVSGRTPTVVNVVVLDETYRMVAGRNYSPGSPEGKPPAKLGVDYSKYDAIIKNIEAGGIRSGAFYLPQGQILSVAVPFLTKRREFLGVVGISFYAREIEKWGVTREEFLKIDFN
jgi:hypothetical protein